MRGVVVSRDTEKNKRQFKKNTIYMQKEVYGGSKALWPTQARRCVATGKAAQRRRMFIMTGSEWVSFLTMHHLSWRTLPHSIQALVSAPRTMQVRFALMTCGCALMIALLYNWGVLLGHRIIFAGLVAVCILLALIIVYLKYEHRHAGKPELTAFAEPEPVTVVTLADAVRSSMHPLVGVPGAHLGISLRALTCRTQAQITSQPAMPALSLQETALPEIALPVSAPQLVRVLETVDLSTVNVPHFMDTTSFRAMASSTLKGMDNPEHTSQHRVQER